MWVAIIFIGGMMIGYLKWLDIGVIHISIEPSLEFWFLGLANFIDCLFLILFSFLIPQIKGEGGGGLRPPQLLSNEVSAWDVRKGGSAAAEAENLENTNHLTTFLKKF